VIGADGDATIEAVVMIVPPQVSVSTDPALDQRWVSLQTRPRQDGQPMLLR
jgi:hypothetical protein